MNLKHVGIFGMKGCPECNNQGLYLDGVNDDIFWVCPEHGQYSRMTAVERLDELKEEMNSGKWKQIIYPNIDNIPYKSQWEEF